MPRHPESEELKKYFQIINNPPKCCHTCVKYTDSGKCEEHNLEPPLDFSQKFGACDHWDGVPF